MAIDTSVLREIPALSLNTGAPAAPALAGRFPATFVWGVATSSFQIEGAHAADGRGPSIWDTYAARPGIIRDGSNAEIACDHYHRYAEDIAIMRALGVDAYRFSIAWPRVVPAGRGRVNAAGLDFYDRLVDALLATEIEPWITLYHWDLPQLLEDEGGWTNRETVDAFAEFADVVSRRLGDRAKHWITHNEPWCASVLGYAQGEHAPGRKSWPDALRAAHHLLLSHGCAVPVLRHNVSNARVGITLNLAPCHAASPSDADRDAARQFDGELNRWFLDPLYRGSYPQDIVVGHERAGRLPRGLEFVRQGDLEAIRVPIDFLGVNYYSRAVMRSDQIPEDENAPRTIRAADPADLTEMGWEVYPEGLTEVLKRIHQDYGPGALLVTENGAAFADRPGPDGSVDDPRRCDYMRSHVQACLDAIGAGVPLHGYFLWSLLDNFEWTFGYSKRFGIVRVDFETLERTIKSSGWLYKRIIRRDRVSEERAA